MHADCSSTGCNSTSVSFAIAPNTEPSVAPNANLLSARLILPGLTTLGSGHRQRTTTRHPPRFSPTLRRNHRTSSLSDLVLSASSQVCLKLKFIVLYTKLQRASGPANASNFRIPIPSKYNIPEWRSRPVTIQTEICVIFSSSDGRPATSPPTVFPHHHRKITAPP